MWTVVQVGFCLGVLLLVCFLLGRKIGARGLSKMHEEMKALETSFNHLLEQMELVSGHNLKVLETKTEELRDMLHAADKKCLYANDLLQEIENARRDLQNRLSTQLTSPPANLHEKKIRLEIQELLEEVHAKIRLLERRLETLEHADRQSLLGGLVEPLRILATGGGAMTAPPVASPGARFPGAASPGATPGSENVIPFKQREEPVPGVARGSVRREGTRGLMAGEVPEPGSAEVFGADGFVPGWSAPGTAFQAGLPVQPQVTVVQAAQAQPHTGPGPGPGPEALAAEAEAEVGGPTAPGQPPRTTGVAPGPAPCPETGLPLPEPGTPFHDVLKLAGQGVSIPQIARVLHMGKGEVELIMNIYGGRLHMRKVL